jgi:hypothetical protein
MSRKIDRQYNPMCATIDFHLRHCLRHRDVLTDASRNARSRPMTTSEPALSASVKRASETLPNPWLFDSEKLLREIDRCREMVLLIPAPTHETHFAVNIAVSAIWNLREDLRYLLGLHRQGQRAFARRHAERRDPPNPPLRAVGEDSTEGKRKRVYSSSGRSGPLRSRPEAQ